ncbi:unnamed protein product, partial [Arabidopsis halleri]
MAMAAPLAGSVTDGLTPSKVSIHVSTTIDADSSIIAHESSVMPHSIPLSDSDVTLNSKLAIQMWTRKLLGFLVNERNVLSLLVTGS